MSTNVSNYTQYSETNYKCAVQLQLQCFKRVFVKQHLPENLNLPPTPYLKHILFTKNDTVA